MGEILQNKPFVFRINENGNGPNLLLQVCLERGWHVYEGSNQDWNLWWRTKGFPVSHYNNLSKYQYTNHIPKGFVICRKDSLIRYMKCMREVHGSVYDFIPEAYTLPREYKKLLSVCKKNKYNTNNKKMEENQRIWICKPVAQSQGRGIFLFQSPYELVYSDNVVVQRYVHNPLLIGGYKFDLRLYILVPSFHPLTVYVYREGLTRFSTEKFSLNNLKNPFAHLTNTSLNKLGPMYRETKERIGSGCKWSLQQLRCYLQQTIGSDWLLWQNISTLIILTLASYAKKVPSAVNCFEFYGFDILIDSTLKPWLMEVNLSPALGCDCNLDSDIKKPMLHDMFDLLGLPISNTGLSLFSRPTSSPCFQKSKSSNRNVTKTVKGKNFFVKSKTLMQTNHTVGQNHKLFNWNETNNIWGNKIDWSFPKNAEGNWVRIFPLLAQDCKEIKLKAMSSNNTTYTEGEIKLVISSTLNYSKIVKEIFHSNQNANDDTLEGLISPYLLANTKIWLPPI